MRLLLRGMVPNARPDDYRACRREVVGLIGRINQRFPNAVHFQEQHERPRTVTPVTHRHTPLHTVTNRCTPLHAVTPRSIPSQERQELDLVERLALWSVASVFVVTSVRERLNLMPLLNHHPIKHPHESSHQVILNAGARGAQLDAARVYAHAGAAPRCP